MVVIGGTFGRVVLRPSVSGGGKVSTAAGAGSGHVASTNHEPFHISME